MSIVVLIHEFDRYKKIEYVLIHIISQKYINRDKWYKKDNVNPSAIDFKRFIDDFKVVKNCLWIFVIPFRSLNKSIISIITE